jgi:menaquinone-dependent protoporphyrinogen oxidase
MTRILVAYASKHQATAEIAETVGDTLRQFASFTVDVQPAETIKELKGYDAVVLGSAVYAGQWQSAATEFLKGYVTELAQRPVWVFSSGPTGEGDTKELLKGWEFPEALKPVLEQIKPREVAVFHGKLDPSELNFFEKTIVKMVHAPMGDFRDWKVIREWATRIAESLGDKVKVTV